jgi:hypothetical protein
MANWHRGSAQRRKAGGDMEKSEKPPACHGANRSTPPPPRRLVFFPGCVGTCRVSRPTSRLYCSLRRSFKPCQAGWKKKLTGKIDWIFTASHHAQGLGLFLSRECPIGENRLEASRFNELMEETVMEGTKAMPLDRQASGALADRRAIQSTAKTWRHSRPADACVWRAISYF